MPGSRCKPVGTIRWIKPNGSPRGATAEEQELTRLALARGIPVTAGSYHSLLFVGYRSDANKPGGGEYIAHDSGAGRAVTMSYEEAGRRLNDIFWIDVTPKEWDRPARAE